MYKKLFYKKQNLLFVAMGVFVLFSLAGCNERGSRNEGSASSTGIIEIRERMFIGQVDEIYINSSDYLGRTIKLEGLFLQSENEGQTNYFVVRYGPGCCGDDGIIGFEVSWAEDRNQSYPAENSWVEAIGELKYYMVSPYLRYLFLEVSSLNVLERRGLEYVVQ